ncbi:MAG: Nicotinate dehydrogenase small FeS subunit [Syntrophorhabdus sp. PtaU1.Bin153]|nr:MAG: Nicotinate dehydrogenase small FeS subunit [Syntrophorhabdus sp. PtaU1.Bin153]
MISLTFVLNGKITTIETPPDRRVIDLLREDFGLTAAKEGCGTGECGACTILVDGESRLSCLMLAAQLEGRSVTTVEGLEEGTNRVGRIQAAFIRHGAVQCGFCTPGMVLAVSDLLDREPKPDRERIREGISGNLCRCTGYQKIVDAVEAVISETRGKGQNT